MHARSYNIRLAPGDDENGTRCVREEKKKMLLFVLTFLFAVPPAAFFRVAYMSARKRGRERARGGRVALNTMGWHLMFSS